MKNFINGLYWIAISSVAFQCHCEETEEKLEVLPMAFLTEKQFFAVIPGDPHRVVEVAHFSTDVTSLVASNAYFYIASSPDLKNDKGSTIWYAKTDNAVSYGKTVGEDSNVHWRELDVAESTSSGNITSMVLVGERLFAGFTNKTVWVCNATKADSCKTFFTFNHGVTAMDYNPGDGNMYVSLSSGRLWRCSLDLQGSDCNEVRFLIELNHGINTFKISFGAIWIGFGSELWTCPLKSNNKNHKELECSIFYEYPLFENEIRFIAATYKYLYVSANSSDEILRCDEKLGSCDDAVLKPHGMGQFIIEDNDL